MWRIMKTATDSATSASSSTLHRFTITPPPNLPTSPSRRHLNNPPPHHLATPPPRLPTSPPPHFLTFAHRHSLDPRIPTPLLGSRGGELGLVRRATPGCRNWVVCKRGGERVEMQGCNDGLAGGWGGGEVGTSVYLCVTLAVTLNSNSLHTPLQIAQQVPVEVMTKHLLCTREANGLSPAYVCPREPWALIDPLPYISYARLDLLV